jgi:hypothetical protein
MSMLMFLAVKSCGLVVDTNISEDYIHVLIFSPDKIKIKMSNF